MIQKEIIDLVASRTKIVRRDLIEKDLILHRLLIELSSHNHFFDNFAFKGGTCLIKCYLDYYRFSEDLDFTYITQREFINKSGKQVRTILSEKITYLMKILIEVSAKVGLDFKADKSNAKYVELGGSNKQASFKLWYTPDDISQITFIKIQVNFLEEMTYSVVKNSATNIFLGKYDDNAAFLLPEDAEWVLKIPKLKCYTIKEILIEKVRAILTRRGVKARDYVDIYMIEKKEKLEVSDFEKQIIEKVHAVMKFEKYKLNFSEKKDFTFDKSEIDRILLIPLHKDFDTFSRKLKLFLQLLTKKI